MPEDLFVTVTRTVEETVNVGVTLSEMIIRPGSTNETPLMAITLAPKNEDGTWMQGVKPLVIQVEGELALAFQELVFRALIQSGPVADANDVVGMNVWDGAKMVLPSFLQPPAEEPTLEEEEQP